MLTRHLRPAFIAAVVAFTAAACAQSSMPAQIGDTSLGKTLVDARGMTLYTFDRDMGGKSACNGPCAGNWPPFKAEAGAQGMAEWAVLTRDDGSAQWAYKGKPLYTWSKDAKPGDVTGDGFLNNAWHAAKP